MTDSLMISSLGIQAAFGLSDITDPTLLWDYVKAEKPTGYRGVESILGGSHRQSFPCSSLKIVHVPRSNLGRCDASAKTMEDETLEIGAHRDEA